MPLAVAVVLFLAACGRDEQRAQVDATLRSTLAAKARPPYVTSDAEGKKLWKLTRQFYERREYAPAWIRGIKPLPRIGQLVAALKAAANEGLDPQLYSVDLLERRLRDAEAGLLTKKGFDVEDAGSLDVWLTYLYMKFASDLADGLSDLAHADPRWHIRPEKFDPVAHFEAALQNDAITKSLLDLTPDDPGYRGLRDALAHYRAIRAKGGWPAVPATLKLKPGQRNPGVSALAARLAASGDYSGRVPPDSRTTAYTPGIQEAVERFQRRHGLTDDGVVGAAVVAEMNVPIEKRIRQIELNLERWRWLPRSLGDRHILVNIPEYQLEVRDGGQIPVRMRVVVGKADTPTPIFDDEMTYVVFSPYWNVPAQIAEGETLPEVLKDSGFLERANMEVIDSNGKPIDPADIDLSDPTGYRFRQRPGEQNSLGLVKFMFPNEHNVYLHDTPTDSLFARASRSFSHGCVRLEQPAALAEYVLRDRREWTKDRIQEAMHASEERVVKLARPIPVYLVYWTARASSDGVMQFRPDVYDVDSQQSARLAERLSRLRKSAAAAVDVTPRPTTERVNRVPGNRSKRPPAGK